jgi:hypothetical protein
MNIILRLRAGNLPARLANIQPGGRQQKSELTGDYDAEDPRYSMPKDFNAVGWRCGKGCNTDMHGHAFSQHRRIGDSRHASVFYSSAYRSPRTRHLSFP